MSRYGNGMTLRRHSNRLKHAKSFPDRLSDSSREFYSNRKSASFTDFGRPFETLADGNYFKR